MIRINNTFVRRIILPVLVLFIALTAGMGYLSIQPVRAHEPEALFAAKLISKSSVMRVLHLIESVRNDQYVPTPIDGGGFAYADIGLQGFSHIRENQLFADFFPPPSHQWQFADVVNATDVLWSNVTPGTSTRSWQRSNVVEMYQAALQGEPFLCGDLSVMLVELAQSGGMQARLISLNRSDGVGHVVVEVYAPEHDDWLLVDPTNNVFYKHEGEILNALELNHLVQSDSIVLQIEKVYGASHIPNKDPDYLGEPFRFDDYYRHGFAVLFFNRWIEIAPPRHNPIRSPSVMGAYVGDEFLRKLYYRFDFDPREYQQNRSTLYVSPVVYGNVP